MGHLVGNLGVSAVIEGADDDGDGVGAWRVQLWAGRGAGENPYHVCVDLGAEQDQGTATLAIALVEAARAGGVADVRAALSAARGPTSDEVVAWDAAPLWCRRGWTHHLRRGPALCMAWPSLGGS